MRKAIKRLTSWLEDGDNQKLTVILAILFWVNCVVGYWVVTFVKYLIN